MSRGDMGPERKVIAATEADWSFLEDVKLTSALRSAARATAGLYGMEEDDLYQEAILYVSVSPELVAKHTVGQVYARVRRYLADEAKAQRDQAASADMQEVEDLHGSDSFTGEVPYALDAFDGTAYPKALVERLLEAMWNEWVIVDEFRPDGDMPRAKPNPKLSGTAMAHKVDMERAWQRAGLEPLEQGALYLTIGRGLTQEAAAQGLDTTSSTSRASASGA